MKVFRWIILLAPFVFLVLAVRIGTDELLWASQLLLAPLYFVDLARVIVRKEDRKCRWAWKLWALLKFHLLCLLYVVLYVAFCVGLVLLPLLYRQYVRGEAIPW